MDQTTCIECGQQCDNYNPEGSSVCNSAQCLDAYFGPEFELPEEIR